MINTDQLVAFTQKLVRQPSFAGEEQEVIRLVVAEMERLGFDRVWVDEYGNAVGVIQGAQAGPTLLFDAHVDTVGIAPGVPWTHDPFGAEIENGAIYGRGTADMKGALAAMVYAAAGLDRSRLAGRVVISASVMEEVFEGGALKAVMDAVLPDYVVIGEATDLKLNRGGRGRAEIHLETIGRPSHSSAPHQGVNAVLEMMKVIRAIEDLHLPVDPLVGPAIMALTDIISEPYPGYSVIPSLCKVTYDRRLIPGETPEAVIRQVAELPGLEGVRLNVRLAEGEHRAYTGAVVRGTKFFPAWKFAEDEPFVQMARRGLQAAGLAAEFGAYQFCTNAAYSAGIAGVPTIGFGPASEAQAHVVDERLEIDSLVAAARGYRGIIEAVLGR
ncbi:MAG: YgeY family selenium metabolism-linked hydrolase [Chloroflexi bacterium]|nr:MAG: YgeY family selenium metabolism-linked hydrolase [Chloroflexota bacterium]